MSSGSENEDPSVKGFWQSPIGRLVGHVFSTVAILCPAAVLIFMFYMIWSREPDIRTLPMIIFWLLGILIGVFVIVATRLESFRSIAIATERLTDSLSTRYYFNHGLRSAFGGAFSFVIAALYYSYTSDATAAFAVAAYAAVFFAYHAVLRYRIRRHLFGDNAGEVEELIDFAFDVNSKGRGGGIRRVNPATLESLATAQFDQRTTGVAGVRA